MNILIYNFLLTLILFLTWPLVFSKFKFNKIHRRYKIWIHCASLGEVKIALKLIKRIQEKFSVQQQNILLTTTTLTAKKYAKQYHQHIYILPLDYYFIMKKTVKKINPDILIILETELWPNLIYFAKKYKSKIFLMNGRISKNTFVFYKLFSFLLFKIIDNIDLFLVRERIDFLRFKNLGVKEDKLKLVGNMKYDDIETNFDFEVTKEIFAFKNDDFIITFGSIRKNEEKEIIKVLRHFKNKVNIKFILAPRHFKILSKIISLLEKEKIKYQYLSSLNKDSDFKCLIIDIYGVLNKIYSISDIVFVCGSILPYGGHNIIEPASLGKLVFFGPYISSFLEPAMILLKHKAALQVKNIDEFIKEVEKVLSNKEIILVYGNRAKETIIKLKGITDKNLEIIGEYIKNG